MFHKYIQTIPVIDKSICDSIINEASKRSEWQQAQIYGEKADLHISKWRSNDGCEINSDYKDYPALLEGMHKAYEKYSFQVLEDLSMEQLRNPMPMSMDSKCFVEPFQLLRYRQNQEYKWHKDQSDEIDSPAHGRTISVVLYLNDDFEGGYTQFVDMPRKPNVGEALFFPSNWTFAHTATPVVEGTKYSVATWYHISRRRLECF